MWLSEKMKLRGYPAIALHSSLDQATFDSTMTELRSCSPRTIITTDALARGFGMNQASHVHVHVTDIGCYLMVSLFYHIMFTAMLESI